MTEKMVLHEGTFYTPEDLKTLQAREAAADKAERKRLGALADKAIDGSPSVEELREAFEAFAVALADTRAELSELREEFDKSQADVGGEDGDSGEGAGDGAAPEVAPEPEPASTPPAVKAPVKKAGK